MADLTGTAQCSSNGECDDGVFCNGAETCVSGSCQSGEPPSCSGDTPFCSNSLGSCVACLINADCADADLCNGAETCNASGTCDTGTAVDCDDGVACTVDFVSFFFVIFDITWIFHVTSNKHLAIEKLIHIVHPCHWRMHQLS